MPSGLSIEESISMASKPSPSSVLSRSKRAEGHIKSLVKRRPSTLQPDAVRCFTVAKSSSLICSAAQDSAFRANGNDHRFYDIHFQDMHKDPVGQVRGLYDWLEEPVSEEFEQNMSRWWQENSANREPSVHMEPEVFGLNLDEIRPQFSEYIELMKMWTNRN